jgi:hypothetical protein
MRHSKKSLIGLKKWSGYEPHLSESVANFPSLQRCVSCLTAHRCESGASCSNFRRSLLSSLVTPPSTLPISTAVRCQRTLSAAVIGRYRQSKRRSSSIPPRIDVHCRTKWPHGTKSARSRLRSAGDLRSLAAHKGYDDMSFREKLSSEGVRPLIKHRVFAPSDHAHKARIEDDLYNQWSVCELVNSVIKRSYGYRPSACLGPSVPRNHSRRSSLQRQKSPQTVSPVVVCGFNRAEKLKIPAVILTSFAV